MPGSASQQAAERDGWPSGRRRRAATFYNLGLAQERRGDLEGSIVSYEKAKELAPDDLRVRQDLGAELCNAGRHQQAIEEFQALLARAPDWNMARPCLYKSLLAVGRAKEAKQVMQDYLRFESDGGNAK